MADWGNNIVLTGTATVKNVPSPTAGTDAVNADWVRGLFAAFSPKDNCTVAAPSNVNIASPGATIDGVTMSLAFPRVLLPNQTNGAEAGIYDWNGAAVPMTRSSDSNTFDGLKNAITTIDSGTNAGVRYRQTVMSGTLETTALVWVAETGLTPAASMTVSGSSRHATQAEVNTGTALSPNVVLTPDTAKAANWRIKPFAATIGDGSTLVWTITHGLNDLYPVVRLRRTTGTKAEIYADVDSPDANTTRITFISGAAPSAGGVYVTIQGGAS